MRPSALVTIASLLLGVAAPAAAQDSEGGDTFLDVGGVLVPVPGGRRPPAGVIEPPGGGSLTEQPEERIRPGVTTVQGRERGRIAYDADGEEIQVYESSRISGVQHSVNARDRFNWFYAAEEVYNGIIPRVRDSLPHLESIQARAETTTERNEVTWIGFQAFPGYTRVFIQLARFPSYMVEEFEGGQVITLVFDNTRLSLTNFSRSIDTSYFGRSVELIDAESLPGDRCRVIIWRNEAVPYTVSLDGGYVYVDFEDTGRGRGR